jgi:hypothetical protein
MAKAAVQPNPQEAVTQLARMGFHFELAGQGFSWAWEGAGQPDPAQVRPLLEILKANEREVMHLLASREPDPKADDDLGRTCIQTGPAPSCYECGHFLAWGSPNLAEAWGRCGKLAGGRYGCALACGEFKGGRDKPEIKPVPPVEEPEPRTDNPDPCQVKGCKAPALDFGMDGQPLCWACLAGERMFKEKRP